MAPLFIRLRIGVLKVSMPNCAAPRPDATSWSTWARVRFVFNSYSNCRSTPAARSIGRSVSK